MTKNRIFGEKMAIFELKTIVKILGKIEILYCFAPRWTFESPLTPTPQIVWTDQEVRFQNGRKGQIEMCKN